MTLRYSEAHHSIQFTAKGLSRYSILGVSHRYTYYLYRIAATDVCHACLRGFFNNVPLTAGQYRGSACERGGGRGGGGTAPVPELLPTRYSCHALMACYRRALERGRVIPGVLLRCPQKVSSSLLRCLQVSSGVLLRCLFHVSSAVSGESAFYHLLLLRSISRCPVPVSMVLYL